MQECYGGFRCHDDSGCIQPQQLCDNYDHCKDRSDETSCSKLKVEPSHEKNTAQLICVFVFAYIY